MPGQLMRVTRDRSTVEDYWQAPRSSNERRTAADYEEGLRAVVDTAVKEQLRGTQEAVGSQLSGGLDSSIVTTSAARLFDPGKIVAFTAVPRKGFDGPVPDATIADESHLAAETARLYPNIEHVIVDRTGETLIDVLDRQFAYMQQPTAGPCNSLWAREISRQAKARRLNVLLVGFTGNLTVTYSGREAWSSFLTQGRLFKLFSIGAKMNAKGIPLRTLTAQLLGPVLPRPLWAAACRLYGRPTDLSGYTAINPTLRKTIEAKARANGVDLLYQPSNDPTEFRLAALFDGDNGNYFKGMLGEFGLSFRDPLSDRRVVEYCLRVPPEEFLRGETERGLARRAFASRLPAGVAEMHVRGYQGADWYESVARDLPLLREELEVIGHCSEAAKALDTNWIADSMESWPDRDWARRDTILRYRYGLLRGISAGHFMRKVAGTN
jgi:asparagine synthase (glutamine-hydrolysing)